MRSAALASLPVFDTYDTDIVAPPIVFNSTDKNKRVHNNDENNDTELKKIKKAVNDY